MSVLRFGPRGLAALGLAAVLAACAPAAGVAADAPAPAEAARLESLEILTANGRARFQVEIADDPAERERGLMYRQELAPERGMLFDFQTPQPVAFWMKNTFIPLDIIYIRPDGRILSIARQTTPHSLAPIPSGGPVLGVLEIPGGRAAELGIRPGDRVLHRIFPGE